MTGYWFKPKRYGYGATPTTWQGWTITLAAAVAVVAFSLAMRLSHPPLWAMAALLACDAVIVAALVIVSRRKTDGEWRWRWGQR